MKQMLDWLTGKHLAVVEWRYASMGSGAQYVIITGIPMMHKWCVDNWDMMDVSAF